MRGMAVFVLGTCACVAFVMGVRNLADTVRMARAARPSALVVLVLLSGALLAIALANRKVWPIFAVGYPSLASVVLESWMHLPRLTAVPEAPAGDVSQRNRNPLVHAWKPCGGRHSVSST